MKWARAQGACFVFLHDGWEAAKKLEIDPAAVSGGLREGFFFLFLFLVACGEAFADTTFEEDGEDKKDEEALDLCEAKVLGCSKFARRAAAEEEMGGGGINE